MPAKTPRERKLAASIAVNTSWARTVDRSARTAPARAAMDRRFEDEVDPERILDPAERAKRVKNARQAYYSRLALESVKARRLRAGLEPKDAA